MAEGAPLLRAYGGNLIEGSNPSLSATKITPCLGIDFAFTQSREHTTAKREHNDRERTAVNYTITLPRVISENPWLQ